jgi:hypothetical protein
MKKETSLVLPRLARRRQILSSLLRSAVAAACLIVLYYILPMNQQLTRSVVLKLTGGLVIIGVVAAWQIRSIVNAAYPGLRAISAVAMTLPMFILLFAATYYLLGKNTSGAFSQPLDRTDALYFTITVFATVGFGDITPVAEAARVVTMVQMLGDLVFIGLLGRIILGAVKFGLQRRSDEDQVTTAPPQGGRADVPYADSQPPRTPDRRE